MTPNEAGQLLAHAAAFDNRKPSDAARLAWAAALHDVPFDADALDAVARYYGIPDPAEPGKKWIQPHHVRVVRQRIRDERIGPDGAGDATRTPPPADPDDTKAYLAAHRARRDAIGSGIIPPPVPAIAAAKPVPDDKNPHVAAVLSGYRAEQKHVARRKAQQVAAAQAALSVYREAVEVLLGLDDHGKAVLAAARAEVLGDEEAAQGFPLLASLPGVMDEHKITVRAAQLAVSEAQAS